MYTILAIGTKAQNFTIMNKKFLDLGTALSRDEMKKITGGCGMGELCDGGENPICKDICTTNWDCPSDRECKSGDCQGIIVKACFRY